MKFESDHWRLSKTEIVILIYKSIICLKLTDWNLKMMFNDRGHFRDAGAVRVFLSYYLIHNWSLNFQLNL